MKKLMDSKPKAKISTRPGKGFSVTQTVKHADQGGVQGRSIQNKDLAYEYQSIQPAISNFDATTAASEQKTIKKRHESINLKYQQGQGSFGSNIPRFDAKDKVASQTSFKRDGDPTKIGPGHYQKSMTIDP